MKTLFPVATGKGLLRPFTLEDAAAKTRLDCDPDIKKYFGRPSSLEADIADFERRGYGLVAIVDRATDAIAGYAKLQCPEWDRDLGLEVVVAVARVARRRGFALEAARTLVAIGCGPLQQKQIVGRVAASNSGSLALVRKLGMTKIGEKEDFFDGIQHIYAISCGNRRDSRAVGAVDRD